MYKANNDVNGQREKTTKIHIFCVYKMMSVRKNRIAFSAIPTGDNNDEVKKININGQTCKYRQIQPFFLLFSNLKMNNYVNCFYLLFIRMLIFHENQQKKRNTKTLFTLIATVFNVAKLYRYIPTQSFSSIKACIVQGIMLTSCRQGIYRNRTNERSK